MKNWVKLVRDNLTGDESWDDCQILMLNFRLDRRRNLKLHDW